MCQKQILMNSTKLYAFYSLKSKYNKCNKMYFFVFQIIAVYGLIMFYDLFLYNTYLFLFNISRCRNPWKACCTCSFLSKGTRSYLDLSIIFHSCCNIKMRLTFRWQIPFSSWLLSRISEHSKNNFKQIQH